MPKRTDIKTILVLGSGPIVIGQGCEFDYSGTQACKALKAEGYRIVLVNSNPATIMTDPQFSDRTYIEPITPESVRKIIQKENAGTQRIDAILPTLGGQTALNCACALWDDGTLKEFGIEMIGANREVIHRAEDRQIFKEICEKLGLKLPKAKTVNTLEAGEEFLKEIGLPAIIRPAFTLGGTGGGIAYNLDEFRDIVSRGLAASMIRQVQIDQSVIGWKEYELEVVRDKKDNCIIVCGIENIDPMGVHTGDSITVAPILTLTDKEYQAMRDAAFAIMRAVGVETGGSNVQFAVNPNPKPGADGKKPFEMVVVEMNPRVSRSSALASKATGFPIAKIAAKLAIGYTLDELKNDITGTTSACFEPAIDYVVTKMPRWTFEKFPEADETLTTQMKSVGEAMAIGRTLKESLQKVIRSMDVKRFGLGLDRNDKWLAAMRAVEHEQLVLDVVGGPGRGAPKAESQEHSGPSGEEASPTGLRTADGQPIEWPIPWEKISRKLSVPSQGRLYYVRYAYKMGWSTEKIHSLTHIDPFFLDQIKELVEFEDVLCDYRKLEDVPREVLFEAKQLGYSDAQLANLYLGKLTTEAILQVREHRKRMGIEPVYKLVDTCAAEFEAVTPYYYSTYESGIRHSAFGIRGEQPKASTSTNAESRMTNAGAADDEIRVTNRPKVVILGGGPNRVGQGIEFDYCCCHAAYSARALGFESVMINSNPETVSTDYDTSDLLFFEPLTLEDVLNIVERLDCKKWQSGEVAKRQSDLPAAGSHSATPPLRHSATSSLVRGLIVQFGGQTPLNLAKGLTAAGAPIIGTSVDSIDRAEDRDRFDEVLEKLNLKRPAAGIAHSIDEAVREASRIGYPVLIRPSYVLGGRGMEICPDEKALRHFITHALQTSGLDDAPVLIDKFLAGATEVDVDVVADFGMGEGQGGMGGTDGTGGTAVICGIMEQIEQAGIHSGDSACTLPPASLPSEVQSRIETLAKDLARELKVCGLMNIQLAVRQEPGEGGKPRHEIYILEVNPRASRTVPFVSKASHVPWPAIAAKAMMGQSLASQNAREHPLRGYYAVKESVFPFSKFPGVDVVLGPEMRSTGEVMGIDRSLSIAFAKSQMGAGVKLPTDPTKGGVFISVREIDREAILEPARLLMQAGFTVYATTGTAGYLQKHGLTPKTLEKIGAGARPNVIDLMTNGQISLVINTPTRTGWQTDEGRIRSTAVRLNVPMITTATAAQAAARAMLEITQHGWGVAALQDFEPAGGFVETLPGVKPSKPATMA
ncbi:MAG: carbamoyl-phosphate synthase large subunit [Tepidisphaera sp.]|nr:carbamoyl-phosphate synthase large subunit [Tepidisphaera sp.]